VYDIINVLHSVCYVFYYIIYQKFAITLTIVIGRSIVRFTVGL